MGGGLGCSTGLLFYTDIFDTQDLHATVSTVPGHSPEPCEVQTCRT